MTRNITVRLTKYQRSLFDEFADAMYKAKHPPIVIAQIYLTEDGGEIRATYYSNRPGKKIIRFFEKLIGEEESDAD